jgi:ABC-type uncharacterized transport system substrate-binding protein
VPHDVPVQTRERGEDILLLARYFLQRASAEQKKNVYAFTPVIFLRGENMKAVFTVFCLVSFFTFFQLNALSKSVPRVFIVMSYEQGNVCGQPQEDGVIEALEKAGFKDGETVKIYHFYMDTKRTYNTPSAIEKRGRMALEEIKRVKPDVVVTIDDNAARTVMLPLIGTDIPVVFSGINKQPEDYNKIKHFMDSRKRPGNNVTGVYEKIHISTSFRVMKSILPGLKKVLCLTDESPTGKAVRRQVEMELEADPPNIDYEVVSVKNFEQLRNIIEWVNNDPGIGAIYSGLTLLKTKDGKTQTAPEIIKYLVNHSKKPEMGVNSVFIKLGLFGGAGVDFRAMGRAAGKKAVRILQGVSASEIPIEDAWGYAIVFNLARAKMLDIQVPPDILGAAREVYNFIPGISRDKESTVFIVQSYGSGVGCGALIENGMMEMLKRSGYMDGKIRFLHFYMETERKYLSREEIEERGKLALQEIYKADPDIVVVLDDNAIEFVMLDLVGTRYPVLFGGMNVSPEYYNKKKLFMKTRQRPGFNVTGVTEEPFYEKTFKLMKYILPEATKVVVLCPASTHFLRLMGMEFEQHLRLHPELYPLQVKAFEYVTTFKRYKELIKQYDKDKEIDIIFSFAPKSLLKEDNTGISLEECIAWILHNQSKPGFTWVADWVRLGFLASVGIDLKATGRQLALKLMQVLNGEKPGEIPISRPVDYYIAVNLARARQLGIKIPVDVLEAAQEVYNSMALYPEFGK